MHPSPGGSMLLRTTLPLFAVALLLGGCADRADTAAGGTDTTGVGIAATDTLMAPEMAPPDGAMLAPDAATRDQLLAVPGMTPGGGGAPDAGPASAGMPAVT